MKIGDYFIYEILIIVGVIMAIGTLLKIFLVLDFSDNWFWFIAGVGLAVEGSISLARQRKFDKKFKIIKKEEYETLMKK